MTPAARLVERLLMAVTDHDGAPLDGNETPRDILTAGDIRAAAVMLAASEADARRYREWERLAIIDEDPYMFGGKWHYRNADYETADAAIDAALCEPKK